MSIENPEKRAKQPTFEQVLAAERANQAAADARDDTPPPDTEDKTEKGSEHSSLLATLKRKAALTAAQAAKKYKDGGLK